MLVTAAALAGWTLVNATEKETIREHNIVMTSAATPMVAQDSVKRTMVEADNLPQGIKTALSAEEYTGWTVTTAYHVEPEKKDAYYEISLEKLGEESPRVVKMDADGKLKEGEITPPALP